MAYMYVVKHTLKCTKCQKFIVTSNSNYFTGIIHSNIGSIIPSEVITNATYA